VSIDGLAGLVRQFELHWSPGFPLTNRGAIEGVAVGCDVGDLDRHDVAAA
jgi:hypothetical protein